LGLGQPVLIRQAVHCAAGITHTPGIRIGVAPLGAGDQLGLELGVVLEIELATDELLDIGTDILANVFTQSGVEFV